MILTPLLKLPNNVGDLGKIFDASGFECWPKVQKIAQYGHTACQSNKEKSRIKKEINFKNVWK